jgi:hypothetical protein
MGALGDESSISQTFQTLESQQRCESLPEEDFKIVGKHIPDLTKDEFEEWIAHHIRSEPHIVHRMSVQAFHGRGTDIEESNQYLIDRGRQLGILCPENEKLLTEVKARMEQQRQKISRLKQEHAEKLETIAAEDKDLAYGKSEDNGEDRLTRKEAQKFEKEKRLKAQLGNQKMPSHIGNPQIPLLGNRNLREVSSRRW